MPMHILIIQVIHTTNFDYLTILTSHILLNYTFSLHFHVSAIAPKPVYDNLAMEPVRKYQNTQINVEDFEAFIETGESEMLKQYEVWCYHRISCARFNKF